MRKTSDLTNARCSWSPLRETNEEPQTSTPEVCATPAYDANGNLTYDTINYYTWDAEGDMVSITPSGSAGVGLTYDALGRMVEQNRSGSYT